MNSPVMYIIANKGLHMSPGKLAAQCAHAAARSAHSANDARWQRYLDTGEAKIVLEARDNDHMHWADEYLRGLGFVVFRVIDEGRTEIAPLQPTALASEIIDKEDEAVRFAFSSFKLYKPDPPPEFGFWGRKTKRRKI